MDAQTAFVSVGAGSIPARRSTFDYSVTGARLAWSWEVLVRIQVVDPKIGNGGSTFRGESPPTSHDKGWPIANGAAIS